MGAKAPEKLKLRRQPCNCDICGRTFVNVQAMSSHKKFMHRPRPKPIPTKERESRNPRAGAKKVSKPPVPKEIPNTKVQTPVAKAVDKSVKTEPKKVSAVKNIQFKCPKCVKVFSAYFSAYKHIQKNHCVDSNDVPVSPNSPLIIKPVRTEQCVFCNKLLQLGEEHECQRVMEHISEYYMCLGCQQTFDNLVLFEHHVKGLHGSEAEYFFFSNKEEFSMWKFDLEATTKIKYVTLTNKQNGKQVYHCSHLPSLQTEKTLLCPSTLSVTEFKSGYQVVYFKEHFGHTCTEMPTVKYKKYLINPYIKNAEGVTAVDKDDNVYQQFKNIMNSISVGAAKVDIGVLNTLLGKALEMTVILNSMVTDETAAVNKSMTDEQITDVLSEVKTYPGKRKADTTPKTPAKKIKPILENDENSKLNNTLPAKPASKTVNKKPSESLPATPLARPLIQSPSFNDSYKDFVDQNFSKLNDSKKDTSSPKNRSADKNSSAKKKVVMKTKIGQFKSKPLSPSPKEPKKSPKPIIKSKIIETTIERTIEYKIKPDVQYEVKEQENDCNILILKI